MDKPACYPCLGNYDPFDPQHRGVAYRPVKTGEQCEYPDPECPNKGRVWP